jgi:hypothetical protein
VRDVEIEKEEDMTNNLESSSKEKV